MSDNFALASQKNTPNVDINSAEHVCGKLVNSVIGAVGVTGCCSIYDLIQKVGDEALTLEPLPDVDAISLFAEHHAILPSEPKESKEKKPSVEPVHAHCSQGSH